MGRPAVADLMAWVRAQTPPPPTTVAEVATVAGVLSLSQTPPPPTTVAEVATVAGVLSQIHPTVLRVLVEMAHRLEGWSGEGDSEEDAKQAGALVVLDPRGAAEMVPTYLSILDQRGVPWAWEGGRLRVGPVVRRCLELRGPLSKGRQ